MFGLLMALIGGVGRLGHSVSKTIEDEKSRDEARREGRDYYWANDGQRRVSDNHKIARGSYGIIDATTGEYIVDKRELERQKDKEYEEENRVSKQEAIIKGKSTYSWKRRTGERSYDWDSCVRLVDNDLAVTNTGSKEDWFPGQKNALTNTDRICNNQKGLYEKFLSETKKYYDYCLYTEKNFQFLKPMQLTDKELEKKNEEQMKRYVNMISKGIEPKLYYRVPDEGWVDIINKCKEINIERIVRLINIYPINEIKWMHQYCFKYDIPMGTWEEVEKACWEEHPVKWGIPTSDSYYFKQFVESLF